MAVLYMRGLLSAGVCDAGVPAASSPQAGFDTTEQAATMVCGLYGRKDGSVITAIRFYVNAFRRGYPSSGMKAVGQMET